jgi:hypothetical protein
MTAKARTLCCAAALAAAASLPPAVGQTPPALPHLKVVSAVVIMPGVYPGVTRAANGDLLATTASRVSRSTDGGATWGPPEEIKIPPQLGVPVGQNASLGMTTLSDGTILWPLNEEKTNQPFTNRECRLYVLRSEDHGKTWTQREPQTIEPREAWAYGKIVELSDGTLLLPAWGMRVLGERWRAALLKSHDKGRTWTDYRTIAWDPYAGGREDNGFNETSLARLPSGEILAIVRQQQVHSYPDERPKDYTEPAQEFYRTFSRDGGDTWALPQRLPLLGTSPALHISARGTLLLGYRDTAQATGDAQPRGLAVRVSGDKGVTWTNETQLTDPERADDDRAGYVGYPDFTNLPDGKILAVFYSGKLVGKDRVHRIVANILEEVAAQ